MKSPGLSTSLWSGFLLSVCALGFVAAGRSAAASAPGPGAAAAGPVAGTAAAGGKFIGASKCRNCHKSEASGNPFAAWEGSKHSKAWLTLATPEAKAAGAKVGVDDPQKSDKCLKCHVTAFGVAAEELAKDFKPELGVQCETCHGPGETHMKARFAAASKAKDGDKVVLGEGEILVQPTATLCEGCHNKESPDYKFFCFRKFEPKIRHLDPRKPLTDERKAELALTCKDADDHTCTHGAPDSPCDKP